LRYKSQNLKIQTPRNPEFQRIPKYKNINPINQKINTKSTNPKIQIGADGPLGAVSKLVSVAPHGPKTGPPPRFY
jgi:hypothetical protein